MGGKEEGVCRYKRRNTVLKGVEKKVRREMPEEAGRAMLVPMGHRQCELGA